MASIITHAITGLAIGRVATARKMPRRFWVLLALLGALPDADAIGFQLGVPYGSTFGHRGFTHSLLFALLAGTATTLVAFPKVRRFSREWWTIALSLTAATASHSVLDAMTTGGLGVAFFSPFDTTRYFFPWRPIKVSPIGVGAFFSQRGIDVLKSEAMWVWLPLAALVGARVVGEKVKRV